MIKIVAIVFAAQLAASSVPAAPVGPDDAPQMVINTYLAAWNRADARAIGAQFAAKGDFINPYGDLATGPAEVEAFYAAAFKHGYAGSRGSFKIIKVRPLGRGFVAADGQWGISGARKPDGSVRAPESGIATAVIVEEHGKWRITLLREQTSARGIQPLTS